MTGVAGNEIESSPYKSKFTVLKFSQTNTGSKSPKKQQTLSPFLGISKQTSEIKPFELSPEKIKLTSVLNSEMKSCAIDLFGQGKFNGLDNFQPLLSQNNSDSPFKNEVFSAEN